MTKKQYKVVEISSDVEQELNKLAKEGWEVLQFIDYAKDTSVLEGKVILVK